MRPKSEWYIVEGTHEPIIDRELWNRVQKMIAERAKPFDVGTIGLFARKARCANCGYVMRSSKTSPDHGGKHYLQCSNRHVAKDACIGSFISVDTLERLVIDELNRLATDYLDKDELEQNIEFCDNLQAQKSRLLSDIAIYEKKVAEYSKGIRELYMDKVKGLISESDYVEMSKDFTTERERLERVIADGEKQLAEIEEKIAAGYQLMATGEMGIGNTTTSSAMAAVFLNQPVPELTGRGAGLSSEGLARKIAAIEKAIAINQPDPSDPIDVLAKVGGFDIAGMAGVFLAGAAHGVPVVMDGFISCVAALLAARIAPFAKDYMIASHVSKEPAAHLLLAELGKEAFLHCDMCLGEGTGAIMLFPILDQANAVYRGMATFDEAQIETYVPLT